MRQTIALEDHDIRQEAPSVFADQPWSETSENYRFLPTISVINAMRDSGFNVVKATQSRCRIEGKGDFTKVNVGNWIRGNTTRFNFLLDTEAGMPALNLLEIYLQCRLNPIFEGFASQR